MLLCNPHLRESRRDNVSPCIYCQAAALRELLEHEIQGANPCGVDCVPGGYRQCTGCDSRVKAVFLILNKANSNSTER